MATFSVERHVEWGDCDAAGIVYYPNFFRWMDAAFHVMTRGIGFGQRSLVEDHGLVGTPLVHVDCDFRSPARYHDDLITTLVVRRLSETSVTLGYRFEAGERLVAEGSEIRVCVRQGAAGLEKTAIPPALRQALEQYR